MPVRRKIRVLVVDDSAVVRKLVTEALARDPEIEVVGTALDPLIARTKIAQLSPDVLTLDIEMPRMDGLTFLREIMATQPRPVIIISSLSQTGSHQALEALRLGAIDVLGKPAGAYSFGDLGPQLREKIKAAAIARLRPRPTTWATQARGTPVAPVVSAPASSPSSPANTTPTPASPSAAAARMLSRPTQPSATVSSPTPSVAARLPSLSIRPSPRKVVLLGASTGGTEALTTVLTELPAGLPGIAIVQHIPPLFSKTFAERLNQLCAFPVREACDGERLTTNLALVAPGNRHLLLRWTPEGYQVRLSDGPSVWHQRPAVDVLFKSAAECAGAHAIAGVFTGMGRDGAEGLLALRKQGALTFSQDETSCVVYGMPRVAWELGGSRRQVPLARAARHILSLLEPGACVENAPGSNS